MSKLNAFSASVLVPLWLKVSCIIIHTGPSPPRMLSITRTLEAAIELNWLPPTEPNGEVHYVIFYTPEGGTERSINTRSDLTHYNLTGHEISRVYTNIAVQAVNSAGRSVRGAAPGECEQGILYHNH